MKECGVDCVKLQTATPDTMTLNSDKDVFKIKGGTLWDGKTLYDLYSEVYTPWEWHEPLQKYTEERGMEFFSSPFSLEAVDFLEDLKVPAFKIASFEITDIPLISYTASKGKPIIISTGIAEPEDIDNAISACKEVGNDQVILLKCTSSYPTPLSDVNLNSIETLREEYNTIVGLSDHTKGSLIPVGAVALGAKVVEKHFILDRELGGPDADFSLTPDEFKKLVADVRNIELAMGQKQISLSDQTRKSRRFSRSLFVTESMKPGDVFTEKNLRSIRPGDGLHPKHFYNLIGKRSKTFIEKGTPLNKDMVNDEFE